MSSDLGHTDPSTRRDAELLGFVRRELECGVHGVGRPVPVLPRLHVRHIDDPTVVDPSDD